jgi:ACR3 family arsenite efflux pump ArsB
VLAALGLVALVVGSLLGVQAVIDVSIVSLVMSGVLFLAAPMVALLASRREDRRA